MEFEIQQADIFDLEVDALVYPGVTTGEMGDSMGERLSKLVGEDVEKQTRDTAPIAVGAATVIEVKGLQASHIIYSPLVSENGEKVIVENVRRCTRAALVAATVKKLHSVAIPVIRPSAEEMSIGESARAMLDELRGFRPEQALRVLLVDGRAKVVDALHRILDAVR